MRTFNLLSSQRICAEIGARIKRLRLQHNLTQAQLAQMTETSLSSVRRLEAEGQGGFEFIVRVAQALQAVDQLVPLFAPTLQSIAELERDVQITSRKRARLPKSRDRDRG
jgi:transcriptional regulator with XRE-family HTH domain